ncbi:MAG: hypothetical protein ACK5JM_01435 [Rhodoblastus sp.]
MLGKFRASFAWEAGADANAPVRRHAPTKMVDANRRDKTPNAKNTRLSSEISEQPECDPNFLTGSAEKTAPRNESSKNNVRNITT